MFYNDCTNEMTEKEIIAKHFPKEEITLVNLGNAKQILKGDELMGYIFYDENGPYFREKGMKKN